MSRYIGLEQLSHPMVMSLRKKILREVAELLSEDTKFVRLATVTTFIHALVFTFWMIWRYVAVADGESLEVYSELLGIDQLWRSSIEGSMIVPILIVGLILFIWYAILHPVGEAAMIIYLEEGRQQGTLSLTKGFSKYFPMVELNGALSSFSLIAVIYWAFRFHNEWILDSFFGYWFIIMRGLITIFTMIFFSYSKILVSVEDMKFFDSLKESFRIAVQNLWITIQFTIISFLLSIRFLINLAIIIGVPLLMIYIGTLLGLDDILRLEYTFIVIMVGLLLLVVYIEWIIEAFFIACRWKVYRYIKERDLNSEELTVNN